ncbi:MAG: NAD(P)-binding domain-containing protein [Rhodospirillaceae bacterium]|nr:NAD(P)-binding domain-containing protein [Rhodospirillaceae bacterium]
MIARRSALAFLAAAGSLALVRPHGAQAADKAETIAIIGTGEVGGTLGKRWAALGHKIIYGSRTPDADKVKTLVKDTAHGATATTAKDAASKADLVLLAIPRRAIKEVMAGLGDLSGKILIDPTNGVKVTDGRFESPPDQTTSNAEEIQALAPGAIVVKALNTLSVEMMADARRGGGDISVPIAGEDAAAKIRVAAIVKTMGMDTMDMGGLYLSRYLEAMARLRMAYRAKNRPNAFEFFLRPRRD